MEVKGPFFNSNQAAEYCGYASGTFERFMREFALPKFGPKKNRFAASILDAWMQTPDTFKKSLSLPPRRRTPKAVKV